MSNDYLCNPGLDGLNKWCVAHLLVVSCVISYMFLHMRTCIRTHIHLHNIHACKTWRLYESFLNLPRGRLISTVGHMSPKLENVCWFVAGKIECIDLLIGICAVKGSPFIFLLLFSFSSQSFFTSLPDVWCVIFLTKGWGPLHAPSMARGAGAAWLGMEPLGSST